MRRRFIPRQGSEWTARSLRTFGSPARVISTRLELTRNFMRFHQKQFLIGISALVLAAPLLVYIGTFGFFLSSDHERWAQFGSFFTGIYAPVFAFVTVLILHRQNKIQEHQRLLESTRHLTNRAKADLEVYIAELKQVLELPGITPPDTNREYVVRTFGHKTREQLSQENYMSWADATRTFAPGLVHLWSGIYLSVFALGYDESSSLAKLQSAQRLLTAIGLEECHALDGLLIALHGEQLPYELLFKKKSEL